MSLFKPNPITLKYIKGDSFGGLTTGVVALPLALAFGVASGLEQGAQAGIYGAIILGFIAAMFGGTAPQVSGPTGPMTVVAAGFIATSGHPGHIFAAVLLGGLLQIVFGLLGLGRYIRYVPKPVVSGFMSGIGVIILLQQFLPLLGTKAAPGPVQSLAGLPGALSQISLEALLLGLLTIGLIYLIPRFSKAVPATLVALVVATVVAEVLHLGIARIGPLPSGLPQLSFFLPTPEALPHVLMAGLSLGILGSLDSLLGSVVVDDVTNTRHHSDKELVGQGMGNAVSALFGGLPGAGATMRTLLNIKCGGRTALSGVIHSLLLTGVLLGLSRYASLIPLAVLAGILTTVGLSIIDYKGFRLLFRSPRPDRIVLLLVFGLTVFVDLITAVEMGFLVACLLFLKNLSERELTPSGSLAPMVLDTEPLAQSLAEKVRVIEAEGPVFFGTSEAFVHMLEEVTTDVKAIVIRMTRVPLIDQTGAYTLQEFVKRMQLNGTIVVLSGLPEAPEQVLRKLKIIPDVIPEDTVFSTLAEAVEGLNAKIVTHPAERLLPRPYLHKVGG